MNNKNGQENPLKKKGFFIALYSLIGVMVVLAVVVTYNNYKLLSDTKTATETDRGRDELSKANTDLTKSYLTQEDASLALTKPTQQGTPATTIPKATQPATPVTPAQPATQTTPAQPVTPSTPVQKAPETQTTPAKPEATTAPTQKAPTQNAPGADASAEQSQKMGVNVPLFDYFAEGSKMSWPVTGDIVMDYSMDKVIYDKTLDQYRTNDTICIAAPAGTPVKATAEGVVVKVDNTRKDGNVVSIDNGNGWITTYGQLMDGVLVKEGEVVKAGQVIGGVANPSIYGVLLGNHLSFKVAKDDVLVDPKSILE